MKIIESFSLPIPEGSEIKSVKAEFNSNIVTINAQVERKFSPRDGDFLISCKGNTFILNTENNRNGFFGCYAGVTLCGIINLNPRINWTPKEGCRYATEKERKEFLSRIEDEYSKVWIPSTKYFKNWEPRFQEPYYYINIFGEIIAAVNYSNTIAPSRNCFKTMESAKIYADRMKNVFKDR